MLDDRSCTDCAILLDWRNSDGTLGSFLSPHTVDTVLYRLAISLPVSSGFVHTTAVYAASDTTDSDSIIGLLYPYAW